MGRSTLKPETGLLLAALLSLATAACTSEEGEAARGELTIAAASSLLQVMPALVQQYQAMPGAQTITVNHGPSGGLRQQVEGGAPIDVVLFASAAPVDALIQRGLAVADSRKVVAFNELILIGPKGAPRLTWQTLHALPPGALLAVGDPGAVPAGHYARQVLQTLGSWDRLEGRMIFGGDVAATLAYARRGEVAAAAVYRTDVLGLTDVEVMDVASGQPWAPRAEVVMAVVKGGPAGEPAARRFLEFLSSHQARGTWERFGFRTPAPAPAAP